MKIPNPILRLIARIPWWLPPLIVAAVLRTIVLASNTVSFHSDEAIVGLMARHINQGKSIPVFFYGQPYMGSLDPLLVSLAFRLFGESVISIRIVQSTLYLGIVGTAMILAYQLSQDRLVAFLTGILFAVPPAVMTLYTTISLGGYGEILILGNLLLLVGYEMTQGRTRQWQYWFALGALIGLGWWTNNLIIVYVVPTLFFVAYRVYLSPGKQRERDRNPIPSETTPPNLNAGSVRLYLILITLIAFFIFSTPWWIYNVSHSWESIRFLSGGFQASEAAQPVGFVQKVSGFFLIGLPAVMGIRFPWAVLPWSGPVAVVTFILYIVILLSTLLFSRPLIVQGRRDAVVLAWLMILGFAAIFTLSGFGIDSTGRYLLPLLTPLFVLVAFQVRVWLRRRRAAILILAILVGVNLTGHIIAMSTVPPGLTPQFDPATDFPNDYDQEVIRFLKDHGGKRGYTTYWSAYRLAFLSGESIILTPMLPYKASLVFIPVDRYLPYDALVESADRPVYVTANLPTLDTIIRERLASAKVDYKEHAIGPFTVFYDLSRHVTPGELGLQTLTLNPSNNGKTTEYKLSSTKYIIPVS